MILKLQSTFYSTIYIHYQQQLRNIKQCIITSIWMG